MQLMLHSIKLYLNQSFLITNPLYISDKIVVSHHYVYTIQFEVSTFLAKMMTSQLTFLPHGLFLHFGQQESVYQLGYNLFRVELTPATTAGNIYKNLHIHNIILIVYLVTFTAFSHITKQRMRYEYVNVL